MIEPTPPLVRRDLHRQVVRHLGLRVLRNEVEPGAAFPDEAALGTRLGVSRTVTREAMKVLAAKGLVESRPKTGTRVRPRHDWNLLDPDLLAWQCEIGPDEAFLRNVTEVRRIIEPAAAGLAATRATDGEIAAIAGWYAAMEETIEEPERFINADLELHAAILAACHNELLRQMNGMIAIALRASRSLTVQVPGSSVAAMPLHWAVVVAIRDRDAVAAEAAMRTLIGRTAADIDRGLHPPADDRAIERG